MVCCGFHRWLSVSPSLAGHSPCLIRRFGRGPGPRVLDLPAAVTAIGLAALGSRLPYLLAPAFCPRDSLLEMGVGFRTGVSPWRGSSFAHYEFHLCSRPASSSFSGTAPISASSMCSGAIARRQRAVASHQPCSGWAGGVLEAGLLSMRWRRCAGAAVLIAVPDSSISSFRLSLGLPLFSLSEASTGDAAVAIAAPLPKLRPEANRLSVGGPSEPDQLTPQPAEDASNGPSRIDDRRCESSTIRLCLGKALAFPRGERPALPTVSASRAATTDLEASMMRAKLGLVLAECSASRSVAKGRGSPARTGLVPASDCQSHSAVQAFASDC